LKNSGTKPSSAQDPKRSGFQAVFASLRALPENSFRRLAKVLVRSAHLVGVAGVFGSAMAQEPETVYLSLTLASGLMLVVMEAYSSWIWFFQWRGIALYVKLLILLFMHVYPQTAVPCLILVIIISGFFSHAPGWIRYYSLVHGRVIYSKDDILG
jgi:hypothetical protein